MLGYNSNENQISKGTGPGGGESPEMLQDGWSEELSVGAMLSIEVAFW